MNSGIIDGTAYRGRVLVAAQVTANMLAQHVDRSRPILDGERN
eukprot:COSAG02_NODE_49514_length_326_cov_0.907489_1_plen_42_part_10